MMMMMKSRRRKHGADSGISGVREGALPPHRSMAVAQTSVWEHHHRMMLRTVHFFFFLRHKVVSVAMFNEFWGLFIPHYTVFINFPTEAFTIQHPST